MFKGPCTVRYSEDRIKDREKMTKQNYEIVLLIDGKTVNVVISDLITFYQEKKDEINVISSTKTEKAVTPNLEQFLKAKRSMWEGM